MVMMSVLFICDIGFCSSGSKFQMPIALLVYVNENTVQSLYNAMFGVQRNSVVSESCYKGTILPKNWRNFPLIPL